MDGWVIVGTKLDTKQLEKDLKGAERRLKQYEREAEKLTKAKAKAEVDLKPYEEEKRLIQQITDEANRYAQTEEEVTNNLIVEKAQLEELNNKYSKQLTNLDNINLKIQENAKNQALVTNEIEETNQKLNKARGFGSIKDIMNDINKSTSSAIKKVSRWAMAVFGVRGAYMAIRNAINVISQGDEQLSSDIEYMKTALAYTIEPIVRGIVNLMKQLMYYVAYIVKAWTGRDIFESANKSLKNANNNAKKLNKTLAGFDEMNIVSDTSSGGGGIANPGFDLSEMDGEVPSWLRTVKDIIVGIGSAIAGLKLANLLQTLGLFGKLPLWQLASGIGLIIWGIATAIEGVINFIKDPSWNAFLTILQGIALIVAGIAILLGGWIVALVALGVAIVAYVIKNWDKVKEILGKVGNWIYEKIIKPVGDFFVKLWDGIVDGVKTAVNWIKDAFSSVVSFFSNLISKIVSLFKTIGTKVGNAIGSAFKTVINGVLKAIESILNFPIKSINKLINVINKVPGINLGTLPTFELPRLAVGGIVNMPGRGVMYGGANIAERGAEGVIPLTNSQMMAQLGEAIGRYVTINANITNTMNGRVISRELQKVNNNSDFAFNR